MVVRLKHAARNYRIRRYYTIESRCMAMVRAWDHTRGYAAWPASCACGIPETGETWGWQ